MKIAYLGQMADVSRETSIAKKIRDQCAAWRFAGHDVRYFTLAPSTHVWRELAASVPVTILARGNIVSRAKRSLDLCHAVSAWDPDIIYLRYAHAAPGHPNLFRRFPTIAELNSDDTAEYALTLGAWKALYHRLTRKRMLRSVAAFIPVTQELARRIAPLSKPIETIGNSIQFTGVPSLAPAPDATGTRLVFMGTPRTPWHGLDRIAEFARLFPQWHIDIVGDDNTTWAHSVPVVPPPNLRLHGLLNREQYLPILGAATVALGTFGLYKKKMNEACPLKIREYLALGLPVIGACADTDIPSGADYYLRLPNEPSSLEPHREAILRFVTYWRGRRVARDAVAHLDTSVKETRRLAFMSKIVDAHSPTR